MWTERTDSWQIRQILGTLLPQNNLHVLWGAVFSVIRNKFCFSDLSVSLVKCFSVRLEWLQYTKRKVSGSLQCIAATSCILCIRPYTCFWRKKFKPLILFLIKLNVVLDKGSLLPISRDKIRFSCKNNFVLLLLHLYQGPKPFTQAVPEQIP